MPGERVRLFTGDRAMGRWWVTNCHNCRTDPGSCCLEDAIIRAYARGCSDDGTVPSAIAARLGYEPCKPLGECPERKEAQP